MNRVYYSIRNIVFNGKITREKFNLSKQKLRNQRRNFSSTFNSNKPPLPPTPHSPLGALFIMAALASYISFSDFIDKK